MSGCACMFLVLGLGLHAPGKIDSPDYSAPNPIFGAQVGYEAKNGLTISVKHMSDGFNIGRKPHTYEWDGYGFNSIWIEKRWNFKGQSK